MGDRDRPKDGEREGEGRRGPPESQWLQLEPARVLYGRAESLATQAAEEILKDAIKQRLRERLGPKLEEIARIAADAVADDMETNFEIEARIAARREARRAIDERVDAVLGRAEPRDEGPRPPGEMTGEGWDPRRI